VAIYFDGEIAQYLNQATSATAPIRMLPSHLVVGAEPIGVDAAVRAAAAAIPGTAPIAVGQPSGRTGSYYVALRFPEDLTPGGRSWAIIDQYSGKPLFAENSRRGPLGTWAIMQNRAIHTGDILGYPTKILMALACLLLIGQIMTGYYMWWKKVRPVTRRTETALAADPID
jgi:uncharacterized iron-regulated membrane protein